MTKPVGIAWSYGRPRVELRRPSDGGTPALPPASVDAEPMKDPKTGRFVVGNRAHRRRSLKAKSKGISTLNPERCESWLRPHVASGAAYGMVLAERFPDDALARLVGATADADTVYRALLALAAQGDGQALKEARGWLREHRACLRELATLAEVAGAAHGPVDPLAGAPTVDMSDWLPSVESKEGTS